MTDARGVITGIGMGNVIRSAGEVGDGPVQVQQLVLADLDATAPTGPVVDAAGKDHGRGNTRIGRHLDGLQTATAVAGKCDPGDVDATVEFIGRIGIAGGGPGHGLIHLRGLSGIPRLTISRHRCCLAPGVTQSDDDIAVGCNVAQEALMRPTIVAATTIAPDQQRQGPFGQCRWPVQRMGLQVGSYLEDCRPGAAAAGLTDDARCQRWLVYGRRRLGASSQGQSQPQARDGDGTAALAHVLPSCCCCHYC
jgi:hypothetical protein